MGAGAIFPLSMSLWSGVAHVKWALLSVRLCEKSSKDTESIVVLAGQNVLFPIKAVVRSIMPNQIHCLHPTFKVISNNNYSEERCTQCDLRVRATFHSRTAGGLTHTRLALECFLAILRERPAPLLCATTQILRRTSRQSISVTLPNRRRSEIARVVEVVHQTMREVIQPLVREVCHVRGEDYDMDWVDPTASASQEWQSGHHGAWWWERSWWRPNRWWTVSKWGRNNWSQYGADTDDLLEEDDQTSVSVSIPISDMWEWS